MKPCPNCAGGAIVVNSRATEHGQRRRWRCTSCEYRWTECGGGKPSGHIRKEPPPLELIEAALTGADNDSALARRFKVARSTIYKIRTGQMYADVLPDLPRTDQLAVTCEQCQHWQQERCDLGFPDPLEMGVRFGRLCNLYRSAA